MSGDVVLADDDDGAVGRLLDTARRLFDAPGFRPAALIGGLAVTCRIRTVHRATVDVDTVTDGEAPVEHALEYLSDGTEARRINIDGVKVDALATYPLPEDADDLPDEPENRLFVLAHRWALESAEPLTIRAVGPDDKSVSASLTVATAPGLLACKLHAIADRPRSSIDKMESDARDIYRLARLLSQTNEAPLADAPFDLAALVADAVTRWLLDDATRTTGLISRSAGPGEASVTRDEIIAAGRLLLARV